MDSDYITLPQVSPIRGIGATEAAQLTLKSAGINLEDPTGAKTLAAEVEKSLQEQGLVADPALVNRLAQEALRMNPGLVKKATDPVISPQPYVAPTDFAAQYPQPLDPTEILTLCEEISVWKALPEVVTKKYWSIIL